MNGDLGTHGRSTSALPRLREVVVNDVVVDDLFCPTLLEPRSSMVYVLEMILTATSKMMKYFQILLQLTLAPIYLW